MFVTEPAPMRRVWFSNKRQDQVIQVQRDRFLCNWRKVSPDHEYPRFRKVIKFFETQLGSFEQFVTAECDSTPVLRQYELTYINHLDRAPNGPITLSDIAKVLPDISWRKDRARWLPDPEDLDLSLAFLLPENAGRLRVKLQSGRRGGEQTPILWSDEMDVVWSKQ